MLEDASSISAYYKQFVQEFVCTESGCFLCIMYVFTKNVFKYIYIYPLPRIHNSSRAYFGLDQRACDCQEYNFLDVYVRKEI
jgi:hypothetical protein